MSFDQAPAQRPASGRGLIITGSTVIVAAVVMGIISGVLIARAFAGPVSDMINSPIRQTPVEVSLPFEAGKYTVFERTGQVQRTGPVTTTPDSPTTLTAADIEITGPDGTPVKVTQQQDSSETLTRKETVFTGALQFDVPADGDYRVRVTAAGKEIVIASALSNSLAPALKWIAAIALSTVALLIGVTLLIIGLVHRSRSRRSTPNLQARPNPQPQPTQTESSPPSGWYPAPDTPGRQRYWDGKTWTDQLR